MSSICHRYPTENRANKIWVRTGYSSDGETLDEFTLNYDDETPIFLLVRCFRDNPIVRAVVVFDKNGDIDERFSSYW